MYVQTHPKGRHRRLNAVHPSPPVRFTPCSYASYNYSAPRLPAGFKFSKSLHAVSNQAFVADGSYVSIVDGVNITSYWNLGNANYNGLNCPYILQEADPDQPSYYLNWRVARLGWRLPSGDTCSG